MDRDILNFNPIVVSRMQQKQLELHQQRLQNIKSFNKSRIATSAQHHNRQNKKALQLEQDKKTEIERNNLVLFNRMLKIMKREDPCNKPGTHVSRPHVRASAELNRIQEQNRTMYERIQKQKPTIDNKKLYEQRRKQENILKFLGKYSVHSLQNAQTQSFRNDQLKQSGLNPQRKTLKADHYLNKLQYEELAMERPVRYEQIELQQELDQQQFNNHLQSYSRNKKSYSTAQTVNHIARPQPLAKLDSLHSNNQKKVPISAKDIILYKSIKEICNCKYEIKIVRSHLAYEIRALAIAEQMQDPANLVIPESQGNQLLEEYNYDYRKIVDRIGIEGNQLVFFQSNQELSYQQQEQYQGRLPTSESNKEKKALKAYFNPSHISEQNEEESYRPADSIGYSHSKPNNRADSLGPQQTDYPKSQQQHPKKLETEENNEEAIPKTDQFGDIREQEQEQTQDIVLDLQNNYHEALDQQIM